MSQARFASCVPLPIEQKNLINVIEKAKDWALMHGVAMRDKNHFSKDVIQVPIFCIIYLPNSLYFAISQQFLLQLIEKITCHILKKYCSCSILT